jgi:hypothetical protein
MRLAAQGLQQQLGHGFFSARRMFRLQPEKHRLPLNMLGCTAPCAQNAGKEKPAGLSIARQVRVRPALAGLTGYEWLL